MKTRVIWDEQAGDDLLHMARRSREAAADLAHVYQVISEIEANGVKAGIRHSATGDIRTYTWPFRSYVTFFAVRGSTVYVAHVAEADNEKEISRQRLVARERIREFF